MCCFLFVFLLFFVWFLFEFFLVYCIVVVFGFYFVLFFVAFVLDFCVFVKRIFLKLFGFFYIYLHNGY